MHKARRSYTACNCSKSKKIKIVEALLQISGIKTDFSINNAEKAREIDKIIQITRNNIEESCKLFNRKQQSIEEIKEVINELAKTKI